MAAQRKDCLVEAGSEAPEGGTVANLEHEMQSLYQGLDVPLVFQAVVAEDGMVLHALNWERSGVYQNHEQRQYITLTMTGI
jgi:hypothetical protein